MGAVVYLSFWWAASFDMTSNEAQTVAFLTLVLVNYGMSLMREVHIPSLEEIHLVIVI
jgi:hypothetical protein